MDSPLPMSCIRTDERIQGDRVALFERRNQNERTWSLIGMPNSTPCDVSFIRGSCFSDTTLNASCPVKHHANLNWMSLHDVKDCSWSLFTPKLQPRTQDQLFSWFGHPQTQEDNPFFTSSKQNRISFSNWLTETHLFCLSPFYVHWHFCTLYHPWVLANIHQTKNLEWTECRICSPAKLSTATHSGVLSWV
jgi:hypothetical protein